MEQNEVKELRKQLRKPDNWAPRNKRISELVGVPTSTVHDYIKTLLLKNKIKLRVVIKK